MDSALFSGIHISTTPLTHTREPPAGTASPVVGRDGETDLTHAGPPSCWHFSGLLHPRDVHSALARLLSQGLDPHFWQRHKLLLCTADLDIWFPLTAKLTNQLNSDTFSVLSYVRLNVFQAQHSAEEFGLTVRGKLSTIHCIHFTHWTRKQFLRPSVSLSTGRRWMNQRQLTWPGSP